MPEKNDNVLITFMDKVEDNSYAGESLRESNKFNDIHPEIEHKRIKIPTGQQVMLSEKHNKVMIIGNDDRTVYQDITKDRVFIKVGNSTLTLKDSSIELKIGNSVLTMTNDEIGLKNGGTALAITSDNVVVAK